MRIRNEKAKRRKKKTKRKKKKYDVFQLWVGEEKVS